MKHQQIDWSEMLNMIFKSENKIYLISKLFLLDGVNVLDLFQVACICAGSKNHADAASVIFPSARHHAP